MRPVTPLRIALRELVELPWDLDKSPGHGRIAGVVLALVGVDIPLAGRFESGQGLIGLAMATLDRDITDIDRLHKEIFSPHPVKR